MSADTNSLSTSLPVAPVASVVEKFQYQVIAPHHPIIVRRFRGIHHHRAFPRARNHLQLNDNNRTLQLPAPLAMTMGSGKFRFQLTVDPTRGQRRSDSSTCCTISGPAYKYWYCTRIYASLPRSETGKSTVSLLNLLQTGSIDSTHTRKSRKIQSW